MKPVADPLMELQGLPVESVFIGDAGEADGGVKVEQEGQVGCEVVGCQGVELAELVFVQTAGGSLVGDGRVDVTVAQDDGLSGEGGPDEGGDVIGSVGKEQKELGNRGETFPFE
mgnify:CR=1 FL=1